MNKKIVAAIQPEDHLLCPIRYALDVVGGKWKLPIICMLVGEQPVRYSSIKRKLPSITNMMLAQSLKELEAAGLVHREQYNEVPPRVEYTLTEKGKSIIPPLTKLAEWGADNMHTDKTGSVFCAACQATK